MTGLSGLLRSVSVELKLFVRDASTPTLLACLLGLCYLLLPGNDASYTILSFSQARPLMDESTYLFAAGVVLSTMIFPYFVLAFGTQSQRDSNLGVHSLLGGQKQLFLKLMLARLFANNLKLLLVNLLLLLFLSGIIYLRFEQPPSTWAVMLFMTLSSLSSAIAVSGAMALEHLFGKARNLHIVAAFAIWFVIIILAFSDTLDVFGLSMITSAIPPEFAESGMAFGTVEIKSVVEFDWYQLPAPAVVGAFLRQNGGFLLVLTLIALAVVHIPVKSVSKSRLIEQDTNVSQPDRTQFSSQLLNQQSKSIVTAFRSTAGLIAIQNKTALILGIGTFLISFTSKDGATLLIPCWLAVVFLLFRNQKMTQTQGTLLLEHSTASLHNPSPELVKLMVLSCLLLIPLTPLALTLPVLQIFQLAIAIVYILSWMILSFSIWRRPVLGMSVFVLFWYGFGLNSMPPAQDLLALNSYSPEALLINLAILSVLLTLLIRGSRRGFIR